MTETSSNSFMTQRTDSFERNCSSVGYVSNHFEVTSFSEENKQKKKQSNRVERREKTILFFFFCGLFAQIKIVEPGTGQTQRINTPGEIWARGYGVMRGYWNQPEKTAETITEDGWLRTG